MSTLPLQRALLSADHGMFMAQNLASLASNQLHVSGISPAELQGFLADLGLPATAAIRVDWDLQPDDRERCPAGDLQLQAQPQVQKHGADMSIAAYESARGLWNHALQSMVADHLADAGGEWELREEGMWRHCKPVEAVALPQGWKIHVSATPNSAPAVLQRCLQVLLPLRAWFKHAANLEHIEHLTSSRCDRGSGGKFITIYPRDRDQARHLCEALHAATEGLPGPTILSDRAYRPGSLVHYRFGAFSASSELSNDGAYEVLLRGPDGVQMEDQRNAWFTPPPWEADLFEAEVAPAATAPSAVLLADRYRVHKVIRHSNRGGIYRAVDQQTGARVIIKQSRCHTCGEITREDARHALRRESDSLRLLRGIAPEWLDFFSYQGDCFLVQSEIDGITLARQMYNLHSEPGYPSRPQFLASCRDTVLQACRLLLDVHARGLVCRDFTPHNIMVDAADRLILIDPELVARQDSLVYRYWTFGFGAPELGSSGRLTTCPGAEVDYYSLGALIFHVLTGSNPPIPANERTRTDMRDAWEAAVLPLKQAGLAHLATLILALTHQDPAQRMSADDALNMLVRDECWVRATTPAPRDSNAAPDRAVARLLAEGMQHLLDNRNAEGTARLWNSGAFGSRTDECNVQHGAAGILGTLVALAPAGTDAHALIAPTAHWIMDRLERRPRLLPGLYFGATGALWAVDQAAALAHDAVLADRVSAQWLRIPRTWPNPDVCHGTAGAGIAMSDRWLRHRDAASLAAVAEIADGLVEQARYGHGGVFWEVDPAFDSALKGIRHYGFGHGVAGIGYFLLVAGRICNNTTYLQMAVAAGDLLLTNAQTTAHGTRWMTNVGQTDPAQQELYYHWCSGSSGVGTFLCRLAHATGISRFAATAEAAANAAHAARGRAGTSVCHGIAGDAEFISDLVRFGRGNASHRGDYLASIVQRAVPFKGRLLVPDESGQTFHGDYNTGLSGVLHAVSRLQNPDAPRMWMADAALTDPLGTTRATAAAAT